MVARLCVGDGTVTVTPVLSLGMLRASQDAETRHTNRLIILRHHRRGVKAGRLTVPGIRHVLPVEALSRWRAEDAAVSTAVPSYRGHRFPVDIISHCVWLHYRFPLSFREVEELMLERGIVVSH